MTIFYPDFTTSSSRLSKGALDLFPKPDFTVFERAKFAPPRRMFDKGQKVACINDDFSVTVRRLYSQLPRKDEVYTIRDVRIGRSKVTSGARGENPVSYLVLLMELHNPDDPYMRPGTGEEMGFRSDRFAPLEEAENTEFALHEESLPAKR